MELYKKVVESLSGNEELLDNEYCSKISMLSNEIAEDLYLLILNYYVENNKEYNDILINKQEYPYNGKTVTKQGKGLNFKVNDIPEELQKILVRYLNMISS